MRTRQAQEKRCSYVVLVERGEELRELASYLSTLSVADCDVVVLDASPRLQFDLNARVLRWVGRHVAVTNEFRTGGGVDLVRGALNAAACEKVIVATDDVRYTPEAIARICELLDAYEVVEPQDYLDPLPWWGGIEAARMLVHRGIEPQPDHGATLGFRRTAVRSLRTLAASDPADDQARRLAAHGAQVHAANDVFVRREPRVFAEWLAQRPVRATKDFAVPMKTAFFLSIAPLMVLLALLGGAQLAGSYAGVIAFAAVALAARGRSGAARYFPLRTCLFAPLWIFERSVSVYWALLRKVRGVDDEAARVAMPDRRRDKVASGQ
jgi:hypothetical protein